MQIPGEALPNKKTKTRRGEFVHSLTWRPERKEEAKKEKNSFKSGSSKKGGKKEKGKLAGNRNETLGDLPYRRGRIAKVGCR